METKALPSNMLLMYVTGLADVSDARQFVFREMLKLCRETLQAYEGDLYHDAVWLHANMSGPRFDFLWSFNESGTCIGSPDGTAHRTHVYRFTVTCESGSVRLTVTAL